ncbi:unnamed protein product, partial [Oppiella nova]
MSALICPTLFHGFYSMAKCLIKDERLTICNLMTQTVKGLLLIPWQVKSYLDVLKYASDRLCVWRPPNDRERNDIDSYHKNSEIMGFFEEFYAGPTDSHYSQCIIPVMVALGATLGAVAFLFLYIKIKPNDTDKVALYNMRQSGAESYGVQYDLCDLVFHIPDDHQFNEELEN